MKSNGQAEQSVKKDVNCKETHRLRVSRQILVTVCNLFIITYPFGFLSSLGVLFVDILDEFNSTRANAAPILSVCNGILIGAGGLLGPLFSRYNGGYFCIGAGFLACFGCIISFFAPNIPTLIFSVGFCVGSGLSVTVLFPYVIIGEMYTKRKLFMLSVTSVFLGVGRVLFPYFTSILIEEFGWRGALLLYSGIYLHCVPVGMLNITVMKQLSVNDKHIKKWKEHFSLSVFKNISFLAVVLSMFIVNTVLPTINLYLVDMLRGKGFDKKIGTFLISVSAFSGISSRVTLTLLNPLIKVRGIFLWSVYLTCISVSILMYVYCYTYEHFLGTTIVTGIFFGAIAVTYPGMLVDVAGNEQYGTAMGYCNFIGGVSGLIGGPLVGLVKDRSGSYDIVYYTTTVLCILAATLLTTAGIKQICQNRTNSTRVYKITEITLEEIKS